MKAKIVRLTDPQGPQLGVLLLDGEPFCTTIELPWRDNQLTVSSIPIGTFSAHSHYSPRFGATYEISVPGRSLVLFHVANTVGDLHGCVGLGSSFGKLGGELAVVSSKDAFKNFMKRLNGILEFEVEVISVYGGK